MRFSRFLEFQFLFLTSDLHSDKAYFLKRQDVSFTTSGAVLGIDRTKTIQFRKRELEIPLLFIRNSACHSVTELFTPVRAKPKTNFIQKMALDTEPASLRQIFEGAYL
mgnify:FL=1